MKKLMSLLILAIAPSAFAIHISCPTSDNYSVDGIKWELFQKGSEPDPACVPLPPPFNYDDCPTVDVYYKYDFVTHTYEGARRTIISNLNMTYSNASVSVTEDKKIKLTCEGTYSATATTLIIYWTRVSNSSATPLKTHLLLPDNKYKNCTPVDNASFECETV